MKSSRFAFSSVFASVLTLGSIHSGFAQTAAPVPTITEFAGTGALGFAGDGGTATQAEFSGLAGLAVDSTGNVYVSDNSNSRIREVLTSAGTISTVAGGVQNKSFNTPIPAGPAIGFPLYNPSCIAVAGGSIYFNDVGIDVVSPAGTLTPDYANSANDLATDSAGNVYGILTNSAIYKYVEGGSPQILAGSMTSTGSSTGDGGPALKATFSHATALAVDTAGNLYVVDSNDNTVRKFQPGGNISTIAGNATLTPANQGPPVGDNGPATQAPLSIQPLNGAIAVDTGGNLYIAENIYRIRKVNTSGIITTYAGTGSSGHFFGNKSPALQAVISPQNIAVDGSGNLYIANVANGEQRILQIAPQATVVTGNPAPTVTGVASAAADVTTVTPGGFASIYGTNFVPAEMSASWSVFTGGLLPTTLLGVSVSIDGNLAGVSFVDSGQINVVVPDDSTVGPVNVIVNNANGSSTAFSVMMTAFSPAFFTLDGIHVIAQHFPSYSLVGPTAFGDGATPALPGETIIIYGTGFGPTNPATPSDALVTVAAPLVNTPTVTVGGIAATVLYAGINSIGLYQLNVTLPAQLPSGDQAIVATLGIAPGTANTQTGAVLPIQ